MNKTTNDLEAKVSKEKCARMFLAGMACMVLSEISGIVMPIELVNYYQNKKDYLEANRAEINYYLGTAERHAKDNAIKLGMFWNLANIVGFAAGLGLLSSAYTKKKEP